jgi:hypothetical protein
MNSLNERISKLESKVKNSNAPESDDLLTKLRKKQDSRKNFLLEQLYSKYYEYLESLSLKDNNELKFIEILFYTIKYVRKNELNIGRTIELSLNSEMTNEIIINFVKLNFPDYPEDFLIESINFISKVKINEVEICPIETPIEKKHWFKKNKN